MVKVSHSRYFKALCFGILCVCALVALTGCSQQAKPEAPQEIWTNKELTPDQKAEQLVAKMSDAEKVGQLIMFGMQGTAVNDDVRYMLSEYKLGGIILFDRNMQSKDQVKTLITDLQKTARQSEKMPLLVAVDQEGGQVARMRDALTQVPAAQTLGQGQPAEAAALALTAGKELKELGFNVNFAPVADLGLPYERSYGTTPDQVIPFVEAVGKAYHQAGLIYSLKHFPGIGRATTDLHKTGNEITASRAELEATDLKPYEVLIPKSNTDDFMVMVSHASYPGLDANLPASLSPAIMQDLLRKKLGFKGVIITDDMEMGAVANHYGFADMSVKALQAGADIVMLCQDYGHTAEGYNAILKAVRSGTISQERLNEAVKHVIALKLAHNLNW